MKKYLSGAIALIFASSLALTAQEDLIIFDIGSLEGDPSGALAPAVTAANLTAGSLTRVGVLHDPDFDGGEGSLTNTDGLFGAGQWPTGAEADAGSYIEFSVTPDENFTLTVDSLAFSLFTEFLEDGDDTWHGPAAWDITFSLDGFTTMSLIETVATPAADLNGGDARYQQHSFSYTDLGIEVGEGQTLSFRFFGYGAPDGSLASSYGGFSNNADGAPGPGGGEGFDSAWVGTGSNIVLEGAVIPEPSHVAVAIAGMALFVTLFVRRRRKQ